MKKCSLVAILLLIALGLSFGLVFAQGAPPEPSAGIDFDYNRDRLQYEGQSVLSELSVAAALPPVPVEPLMPCPTDVTSTTICDVIATKAEDIVGVWSVYFNAEPAYVRYNPDGTWVIGDTVESTTASSVEGYPSGMFSFDEDGLFTSLDPNTPVELMPEECRAGHYQLRVIKVGGQLVALNHAVRDDCFAPRRTDWGYTMLWAGSGE